MGLNLSNRQISGELGLNENDVQVMTAHLRAGLVAKLFDIVLEGEVQFTFFQFTHNARRRGKALLGALVGTLLARRLSITPKHGKSLYLYIGTTFDSRYRVRWNFLSQREC
ncbi:hypothetical protein GCM10027396_18990 [Insolitispirillum peregrinum]